MAVLYVLPDKNACYWILFIVPTGKNWRHLFNTDIANILSFQILNNKTKQNKNQNETKIHPQIQETYKYFYANMWTLQILLFLWIFD